MKITKFLIIINIVIFAISQIFGGLYYLFGLNVDFFIYSFYWQILTSMFMHSPILTEFGLDIMGIFHIGMNMAVLWQIGGVLERFLGSWRFLAVYLILGVLTSLISSSYIAFFNVEVNIIGASGAICALFGILACYDPRNAKGLFIMILLISFAPFLMGIKVAWYAHLVGFILGYLYALIRRKFGIF